MSTPCHINYRGEETIELVKCSKHYIHITPPTSGSIGRWKNVGTNTLSTPSPDIRELRRDFRGGGNVWEILRSVDNRKMS